MLSAQQEIYGICSACDDALDSMLAVGAHVVHGDIIAACPCLAVRYNWPSSMYSSAIFGYCKARKSNVLLPVIQGLERVHITHDNLLQTAICVCQQRQADRPFVLSKLMNSYCSNQTGHIIAKLRAVGPRHHATICISMHEGMPMAYCSCKSVNNHQNCM